MSTILIGLAADEVSEQDLAQIRAIAPHKRILVTQDRDEIEATLDEIEIAVASFPRDLLPRARYLRWLQQWGAGADWLMRHPEAIEMDFVLTNASGVHAVPISEHIFAYLPSGLKNATSGYITASIASLSWPTRHCCSSASVPLASAQPCWPRRVVCGSWVCGATRQSARRAWTPCSAPTRCSSCCPRLTLSC